MGSACNSDEQHARNQRRFGKADDELVGWFAASIGVRAQTYERGGSAAFDSNVAHGARLRALEQGGIAWFDRVAATIRQLAPEHRRVLVLVYTPHSWPTWLADALSTPWGGGSFVALASTLPRAAEAAMRSLKVERVAPASVMSWFGSRGRGGADELFRRLKSDGEEIRLAALAAYDALRVARLKREQAVERKAKEDRERANAKLLAEKLAGRRRKARAA